MPSIASPETPVVRETDPALSLDLPWHVIIHNDPVNLMSYVSHVIRKIFGYSEKQAQHLMLQVHQEGRSRVWTGGREKAEHYVRELHGHQLLATLEKAD